MFRLSSICACTAFLLATTLVSSHALAQTWATGLFKETKHNFGVVARGATTKHVFQFKNTTNSTIHLGGARTSCNCTVPTVVTPTVAPGETGRIQCEFNTRGFQGQHGANVTVTVTSPSYTEVQLRVDGFIRGDVVFEPGEVKFGNVIAGDESTKSVVLSYAGKPTWAISSVKVNNPHLKTELVETKREGNSIQYQVNVKLDGKCKIGYLHEEIRLITNEPNRSVPLMVSGLVNAPIQVPSIVDVGRIKSGDTINKTVIVKAHRAFTVLGIENEDSRISVAQPNDSKRTHLIKLTINGNSDGQLTDEVILKTDDPAMPEARIKVRGDVN